MMPAPIVRREIAVFALLVVALTVQARASGTIYEVEYPPSTTEGELQFGVKYRLWVPQHDKRLRGVIVHQHGCGTGACKGGETAADDLHWQALADRWDCALLGPSYQQPEGANCRLWCDPRNGSENAFLRALDDLAKKSQHPELSKVPWCLWGHSGGAFWASIMECRHTDRVVAVWLRSGTAFGYWEKGEIEEPKRSGEITKTPIMLNPGAKEKGHERFKNAWDGSLAMFKAYREKGALIGFAPDPNTAHECGDSRYLAIPFFDDCLKHRLPNFPNDPLGKVTDAWLAPLEGSKAAPSLSFDGDPKQASWLPGPRVAHVWEQYVTTGKVEDSTPPDAPTDATVVKNAEKQAVVTWSAEADFESGLQAFEILRDGKSIGRVPQESKGKFGRPLFQGMSYHDTPEAPLAAMKFVDAEAKPETKHEYQVVAINGVGLKSVPSEAAKEAAARADAGRLIPIENAGRGVQSNGIVAADRPVNDDCIGCGLTGGAGADAVVPKGEVAKYEFSKSKVFPGTVRDYWVYVPAQYSPAKPACVFVCQDGIQYKAPEVFDRMIAAGEMPVTIGVFVMHGRVKATSDMALDRFNRSYEYDGLGDNYARFLLDELLPEVETKKAADGRAIRLSQDGNDRCIAGNSSGAICAFTAAWERPDAFSRVFSAIGTYVGLRGGHEYPTLIRKFEPKPIRVFLQDGSNDLNIYGGDWWIANQAMQRSLAFAGYEHTHVWGDGAHNSKHATEIFRDGMLYLWKDWPSRVTAGKGSPQMQEILLPGADWQLVAEGFKFTEGPAVNTAGEVFFNEVPSSTTYKVALDGTVTKFLDGTSNKGDGQAFGPDGRLYSVAGGSEQIVAYDAQGKPTTIADGFRGNDLVVRHDGSLYVTEPGWDGKSPSKVWFVAPDGKKRTIDTGLKFSNGLTLSPDQSLLYVADSRTHWVYSYQIQPDGGLAFKQKYFHLHVPDTAEDSGADGVEVDRDGRVWVATKMGLQVCDQAGRVLCILPTPNGKVSNLTFGGPEFDTVFATSGDKVFKRKVKVRGAPSWDKPMKPAPPRL